ncbi:TIGR03808 family TAT-translocated repetitive protein [Tianweitania sediminis]|jgi:uncharacterized secreted repeat protein (TIGR03808 family)|uniref:TIGR03808 family TAT-translocated repetitive protein n=1 Tax=Tianweitania sediminis TaxID=1502156 RepID=A0A8J7UIF6_9HYPH|nr:TIGR03808 family TAT-translocated repetitive protein [Tianweitania sediminis]MBP0438858.1 TIGR03808 family TAT-translocated repetitive protein [Tianweitania sediminis]HEV7415399.1 TIGR03808 family TAT-translocated repetitive protein [Tianweitania sediminis]
MLNRRALLTAGLAFTTAPAFVQAQTQLRGGLDGGAAAGSSQELQRLLEEASERSEVVYLPAGTYAVSNLVLPRRTRITGVPGATRLIFSGGGAMVTGEDTEHVELTGLTFDGANTPLGEASRALIDLRRPAEVAITRCVILNSAKSGLALESAAGRVEDCTITGAAEHAIYSVQARGLSIAGNTVADCGDGGILVHRWEPGEDGTIVSENRISRIGARSGGTGQVGNGINLFRAHTVTVSNNKIADCAFSAIRSNGGSNAVITGNSCLRSGETGLYAEFQFDGAVIGSNLVDGAANGISVVNFNEGGRLATVTGNIVRNLRSTGPYPSDPPGFGTGIAVEADTVVTGNVVENAPLFGIHLGWGEFMRNVVASNNVIREAGIGISVTVVEGTGSAVVTDNVISGARNGSIIGHRWTERATGDLATGEEQPFANLRVSGNQVL